VDNSSEGLDFLLNEWYSISTMKIENVIDFVKTLNQEQRAFFLAYRHQIIQREKLTVQRLKCERKYPRRQIGWDASARELAEMEQRKRSEQGIYG
jgi:hypothetical protein